MEITFEKYSSVPAFVYDLQQKFLDLESEVKVGLYDDRTVIVDFLHQDLRFVRCVHWVLRNYERTTITSKTVDFLGLN